MDTQNNIAVLLQPSPQSDLNFSNQTKNHDVEDSFQNIFEETTHKIKQAEQQQNQTHQRNTDSKPDQTQDQKTEIKTATPDSKNITDEEGSSFETKVTTAQNSGNQTKDNSVENSVTPNASEKLMVEKLKSLGLDGKTIQGFLSLFDSKSIQIDENPIYSLLDSDKDLLQSGAAQLALGDLQNETEAGSDLATLERFAVKFLSRAGVDANAAKQLVRQMMQTSTEAKNSKETPLKLPDLQPTKKLNSTTDPKNATGKKANQAITEKLNSATDTKNTTVKEANQAITEKLNSATDTKNTTVKEAGQVVIGKLNPATDTKNTTVKEAGQVVTDVSEETNLKITSNQFQKEAIKNSKLETAKGKSVRQEPSNRTQIRIQDPATRTLKTNTAQQSPGTKLWIQAAELNFQNSQDSFTQFHQNLGKASVEAMPQNTAPGTDNFARALRDLEINRPVLPKGASERSIVDQVVQKFSVRGNGQNSEIKMRLEPPSLGTVRMNITTQGETVKTTIFAENHAVKQVIENNLSQLKDSFSDQGLKVGSFQVMVGGEPGFKDQQPPQQQSSPHRLGLKQEDSLTPGQLESSQMQTAFSRNTGGLSIII